MPRTWAGGGAARSLEGEVRQAHGKAKEALAQRTRVPMSGLRSAKCSTTLRQSQNSDAHFREVKNTDLAGLGGVFQFTVPPPHLAVWDLWKEVCLLQGLGARG